MVDWQSIRHNLYLFALKRVNNEALAEDIVQDILVKAIQKMDELQDEEKFLPWLYTIGRNRIVDYYRQKRPEQALPEILVMEEEDNPSVLEELGDCLQPLLDQLPEIYRNVIIQAHFSGKKLQEIAEIEGISLAGVKSRVQRGRQQLKVYLEACCRISNDHLGNISEITFPQDCGTC